MSVATAVGVLIGCAAAAPHALAVGTSSADMAVTGPGATWVAAAGDVNADGYDDLVTSGGGGDAYIVLGGPGNQSINVDGTVVSTGGETRGYRITEAGSFLYPPDGDAKLGDVNGDGKGDFALVEHTPDGGYTRARVWVVFGKAGSGDQSLDNLGGGGFVIGPQRLVATFKPDITVDGAGDVDGDGRGDVVIGNPDESYDSESGRAYVVFGKGSSTPVDVTTMTAGQGLRIHGTKPFTSFEGVAVEANPIREVGWSVAGLGRVNDDALGDIAISTTSGVFVVFGRSDVADIYLSDLEPSPVHTPTGGFRIFSSESGALNTVISGPMGPSVAGGADLGGDFHKDVLISDNGAAYVVYGKNSTDSVDVNGWPSATNNQGWAVAAARPDLSVGFPVIVPPAVVGDIRGDSHSDFVLPAPSAHVALTGSLFVMDGGDHSGPTVNACELPSSRGVRFDVDSGSGPGSLGDSLAGRTDFNGDGRNDLVVGNWHEPMTIQLFFGPADRSTWSSDRCREPNPEWINTHVQPHVMLDASESWHPLDVNNFLGEYFDDPQNDPPEAGSLPVSHRACDLSGVCHPLTGPADLTTSDAYIDIRGNDSDPNTYRRPGCSWEANPDCFSEDPLAGSVENPIGVLYRNTKVQDPYQYVNYFWFFRFNDSPAPGTVLGVDTEQDHEGDWEGISIAMNKINTATVAFAIHESHGDMWRYLSDVLRCGGLLAQQGSCGYFGEPGMSTQVNAYVAEGTHASYPTPCEATCFETSNDVFGYHVVPEGSFGGQIEATADVAQPVDNYSWAAWPGKWGASGSSGSSSPTGPSQKHRYSAPWDNKCTARFSANSCPASATLTSNTSSTQVPNVAVAECDPWFSPTIVVGVCNGDTLRRALATGTVEVPSGLEVDGPAKTTSAVGTGIAQLAGRPLTAGQSVKLSGLEPGSVVLGRMLTADGKMVVTSFKVGNQGSAVLRAASDLTGERLSLEAGGSQLSLLGSYTLSPRS